MTPSNHRETGEERELRAYTAPEIVLELNLETRAGSILPDAPDGLDLTGLGDAGYTP
jgi:hypothetical protein